MFPVFNCVKDLENLAAFVFGTVRLKTITRHIFDTFYVTIIDDLKRKLDWETP